MTGEVAILNVAHGDTKLIFDKSNVAETFRASRIVRDMMRRGYVLLVEVTQPDGEKRYQRAEDFDPETAEYIIADFDPLVRNAAQDYAAGLDTANGAGHEEGSETSTGSAAPRDDKAQPRRGRPSKRIAASSTKAVAVARTAGG